jgi:tRNA threonylcarbamoyladenosine biosynthesis protein TsaB
MRIVAVEMSASEGSVALVDQGQVEASFSWKEKRENRQQLFDALKALAIEWSSVDQFVVGRGPGAFSGMRIAFSVVNALAAPDKTPVVAHNSGAALVYNSGASQSVVVGDARRNQLWIGAFEGLEVSRAFTLIEPADLPEWIQRDTRVLSPDYDRLTSVLDPFMGAAAVSSIPRAADLARVVDSRASLGLEIELFEPLYLHPPVFVEPRFPA